MIKKRFYNPAQLFIFSFFALIVIGSILLKLPIALNENISWTDSLFTATSAVCVTGLVVVDTSTHFTTLGQVFILLLIQAGGIGILSFASLFTYFLKGGSSYENQLAIRDFSNTQRLSEVFTLLKRTIVITFGIEAVGATVIYFTMTEFAGISTSERIFIAVFHSVSSFCNAGFSTLPNGLMYEEVYYNYGFQLAVANIYIFGGLGFPIVINVLKYIKHLSNRLFHKLTTKENYSRPWVMTINSKLNLITTSCITVFATVVLFISEYNHVFADHSVAGKWVIAFATATTPRTAGFNSIDFSQLHSSSILFVMLLMWIGASPNSTGGGIKTSTFALAILNAISLAKGKDRTEIFKREIAGISIQRAFATMFLSLIILGIGIYVISFFERERPLLEIAFECFSAYSTVGLSLGITGDLAESSKVILLLLMFTGRVTMLSVLIAFFKKVRYMHYRYPEEELTIY